MSEWIANNREVFLVTYTQIGSSHQQTADLQSEHNQFAMSAMVRSAAMSANFSRSYCAVGMILLSVCLSVCNAAHCGPQGWCRGLKVVPSCSYEGTSYSLLQTLLL